MATRNRRTRNTNYVSPTCPPGWAWLLAGILIGVFISFLIYLREIAPHTLPEKNTQTSSSYLTENLPNTKETVNPVANPAPSFDFYEVLPNAEVKIPSKASEPLTQTDLPITVPGRYLLQVGSFRNEQEAEGLKTHLASLGIPAHIEKTTLSETGRWHRVQVGPFTDLNKLNQTRTLLTANNISAILRKY